MSQPAHEFTTRVYLEDVDAGGIVYHANHLKYAEQRDVLEEVIEPYLIQQGLIQRTPRGRLLTETGWRHLDKPVPPGVQKQLALLPVEGEEE